MTSARTLDALKRLSQIGTTSAAENAYNEYQEEKDVQQFEQNINKLLPDVAMETNTNPSKMAANYAVSGSGLSTMNIDTNVRAITQNSTQYAGLPPNIYNKKLAEDLLPSLQLIRTMSGVERTVAMNRFEEQIKSAQASHMKANKQYVQTQTQNVLSANINTTVDNIINDTRNMTTQERTAKMDQQLTELLAVSRERGLDDLTAQKVVNDVFIGKITYGDIKAEDLLETSEFRAFINPESLRVARATGEARYLKRFSGNRASGTMTAKEEALHFDEKLQKYLTANPQGTLAGFIAKDPNYIMSLGNKTFNRFLMSKPGDINKTKDTSRDADVQASRKQMVSVISTLKESGMLKESVKGKLTEGNSTLGSVIDAIYGDVAEPWGTYDRLREVQVKEDVRPGYTQKLSESLPSVRESLVERLKNHGETTWLGKPIQATIDTARGLAGIFSDSFNYTRRSSRYETTEKLVRSKKQDSRILSAMSRYESLKGAVDWSDEDIVEEFLDFSFTIDAFGNDTQLLDRGEKSFTDTFGRQRADGYVKDIGLKLKDAFVKQYKPTNPERYTNILGNDSELVTYEIDPRTNRMRISFHRYDSTLDRVLNDDTRQLFDGMWKLDLDDNGDYQFYLLDKDKYEESLRSPVLRSQLQNEGWVDTLNGAVEIDTETFKLFGQGQLNREGRAARERERSDLILGQSALQPDLSI